MRLRTLIVSPFDFMLSILLRTPLTGWRPTVVSVPSAFIFVSSLNHRKSPLWVSQAKLTLDPVKTLCNGAGLIIIPGLTKGRQHYFFRNLNVTIDRRFDQLVTKFKEAIKGFSGLWKKSFQKKRIRENRNILGILLKYRQILQFTFFVSSAYALSASFCFSYKN